MCTSEKQAPQGVADALAAMDDILGYLRDSGAASLLASELGAVLETMGTLSGKFAAVRAGILSRFDAERAYTEDGYGSTTAWLKGQCQMTPRAAGVQARRMRQGREHPVIDDAVARGELPDSWLEPLAELTRKLPEDVRRNIDQLLVDTASAGGVRLEDLAVIALTAVEKWKQQQGPDDDPDDGFDDRYLKLSVTFDGAGRLTGDLTPECAGAVQAALQALGKKAGQEDERTEGQRLHDALQLACELLLRARLVPDRAGADAHLDGVISLAALLKLPGASELEEAWLAALAGRPGYLAGKGAEAAACDAVIHPVVVGHPDLSVVDAMIDIVLGFLDGTEGEQAGHDASGEASDYGSASAGEDADAVGTPGSRSGNGRRAAHRSQLLSPEAWRALRYAMARLAIELVSGPAGVAAILRQGLLDAPYNGRSVPLDVGASASIPGSIRRAVQLRAGHCEWPGCDKPPVCCDVHHLVHQADGGETSLSNCVLLCQFHVCVEAGGCLVSC